MSDDAAGRKLKVFISYSRRDIEFAQRLVHALEARGLAVTIDTRDLPTLEDWRRELLAFIRGADAVVFVISRVSVASPICTWEIEQVTEFNKRLAPIILEQVPDDRIPDAVSRINYLSFEPQTDFDSQADRLAKALQTDLGWVKEHTRLGEIARRWNDRGRPRSLLLRGTEIGEAEAWINSPPPGGPSPTERHRQFVAESRKSATRRQRAVVVASLAVALVGLALAGVAFWQRQVAVNNQRLAEERRILAEQQKELAKQSERQAKEQRNTALLAHSQALSRQAMEWKSRGDAATSALIALEGLPDGAIKDRPFSPQAEKALYNALLSMKEVISVFRNLDNSDISIFTGDDTLVAFGQGAHIHILEAASGKRIRVLRGHWGRVRSVVFDSAGERLVSTSADGTLRVWDARTGRVLGTLKTPAISPVTADYFTPTYAAFNSTGDKLYARFQRGLHDVAHATFDGRSFSLISVFSISCPTPPSDRSINVDRLIALCSVGENAGIWDVQTGTRLGSPSASVHFIANNPAPSQAQLNADGSRAVVASPDGVRIWETSEAKELLIIPDTQKAAAVATTKDGALIAVSSNDGSVRIVESGTGKTAHVLREGGSHIFQVLAFSAKGDRLVGATFDGAIAIWNSKTGEEIMALDQSLEETGLALGTYNVGFSPKGNYVISTTLQGFRLWRAWEYDWVAGEASPPFYSRDAISPDGRLVLVPSYYSEIAAKLAPEARPASDSTMVIDLESRKAVATLRIDGSRQGFGSFSPNGELAITTPHSEGQAAWIWETRTGKMRFVLDGHRKSPQSAAFSPDGLKAVTTEQDFVRVWDARTGKQISAIKLDCYLCLAEFSPDSHQLLLNGVRKSGIRTDVFGVTDLSGSLRFPLVPADDQSQSRVGAYSPKGSLIAIGHFDGSISIFDGKSGTLSGTLRGHSSNVNFVSFSADERMLASGADDKTARIWQLSTLSEVGTLPHRGQVRWLRFSDTLPLVVTQEHYGLATPYAGLFTWPLLPNGANIVEFARKVAPRCLTPGQRQRLDLDRAIPQWCFDHRKWPYVDGVNIYEKRRALDAEKQLTVETAIEMARSAFEAKNYSLAASQLEGIVDIASWDAPLTFLSAALLLVGDFDGAERAARSSLFWRDSLEARASLAHALMFQDRLAEARAIYLAHRGKRFDGRGTWEEEIRDDFRILREANVLHNLMDEVHTLLGQL